MDQRKRPRDGGEDSPGKKLKSGPDPAATGSAGMSQVDIIAQAKAQIAAKLAAMRAGNASAASPSSAPGIDMADLQRRVAEAKAKVSGRVSALGARHFEEAGRSEAGGSGLKVGLHPALMGDITTTQSKKRKVLKIYDTPDEDLSQNSYFDPSLGANPTKSRAGRSFEFVEHGRYIQQAAALRQQARLEELKRSIAATARKAGFEDELDTSENAFRKEEPPEVEWWDQGLVTDKSYDEPFKIAGPDSIVTLYVQHPIPIPPPGEKPVPARPLVLTKKEQKKIRRQARAERLKDKQDQQRLGLIPPDPPKVKLNNLMRVLTSEAVKDPTAVEREVRQQVAARKEAHEQDNEERKLTPDQRREKVLEKLEKDGDKGIRCAVFRIEFLPPGSNKFKVEVNANQHGLTGVGILNPSFNLVIVEGGPKSVKKYKHLMLERIDWTDASKNAPLREDLDGDMEQDLTKNRCELVWEGDLRQRNFRMWKYRRCEDEQTAREVLTRGNCVEMWTTAKAWGKVQKDL
ncbi:hypothetical protein G7K_4705-t1 [Saitoella complicata NRRL Y-17804]|uniref:Uncharacterized protein n=1 Tax=Saitoella complicata (strain BCRC 22490 / CBS 7301 / JCM 7358 / NBRC 10748 / NRRL Y-17804) TaxID=698492 RepID=A0A0E9NLM5_SAICN|nr:hypothetical protein G7K_4705-t1 [Saitoella complicata NRRL Y-17804]